MSEGTGCKRPRDDFGDGFLTKLVLTTLVPILGRGTGIAMAAACGGSSFGAA